MAVNGGNVDMDASMHQALAVGLCTFDVRIGTDGFIADEPCRILCDYCLQQAAYLANMLQKGPNMTNNQLKSIIERIESLEEDKAAIAEGIKEIYLEAKGNGFDPKIIKQVVALRKKDASKRREEQALLATYLDALGMLSDTPLGQAAMLRDGVKTPSTDDGFN